MWIIRKLLKRRSAKPAWESLSHEERGIIARNSGPGDRGTHERIKGEGFGPPGSGGLSGRK